jgi:hypothetical protein
LLGALVNFSVSLGTPMPDSGMRGNKSETTGQIASSDLRDLFAKTLTPEQLLEAQRLTREWEELHPVHSNDQGVVPQDSVEESKGNGKTGNKRNIESKLGLK